MTTVAKKEEPLTKENPDRFALFPIRHPRMWFMYKQALAMHWSADEIDVSKDAKDFQLLTPNEQHFLRMILAFFAVADGMVTENLAARMLAKIQVPEARAFYSFQIMNEQVHAETYGKLLEAYVTDVKQRRQLFQSARTMPCIQAKADWFMKRVDNDKLPIGEQLLGAAIMEGMFFQASFCGIFWFKDQKFIETQYGTRLHPNLPGLYQSNALIVRDEGGHFHFGCYLYRGFVENKLSPTEAYELIQSAVVLEENFIRDALPHKLVGMNSKLMIQYVHCVANKICEYISLPPCYKDCSNPFSFMDGIGLIRRGNFFELHSSEYKDPKVKVPPETDVDTLPDDDDEKQSVGGDDQQRPTSTAPVDPNQFTTALEE